MSAENSSSSDSSRRDSIRPESPTVAELAEREGLSTEEFLHRQVANLLAMQEAERKLRLENERKALVKERRRLKACMEEISKRIDEIDRDN